MQFKKIVSGILISALCISMAACGKGKNTGSPGNENTGTVTGQNSGSNGKIFEKPYEISMLLFDSSSWPFKEDWYVKKTIEESTNAVLKVIPFDSTKYTDKVNLLMASGDAPDIIIHNGSTQVRQYASQGAFVNVSENLDKVPNFKAWAAKNEEHVKKAYCSDGKLYSFPTKGIGITNTRFWFYRKDVFDKYGLKAPKTDEELYSVLKTLKEKEPGSFPLNYREMHFPASWDTNDSFYYDFDKKEWRYGPVEDSYREMVTFLRKLYQEKLIPQDIYSQNAKAWTDMMVQGKSYITYDYVGRVSGLLESGKQLNKDYDLEYMPPLNGKFTYTPVEYSSFTLNKNAKNTDNLLKLMNWYYSEEAYELLSWGKEGVTYKVEDGKKKFIDPNYRVVYGIGNIGWFGDLNKDAIRSMYPEMCIRALDEQPKYEGKENPAGYMALNDKEMELNSTVGTSIKKFKDENIAQFVTGQKSMSEWDSYVKSIKAIGVDKMIEMYTGAYKRLEK